MNETYLLHHIARIFHTGIFAVRGEQLLPYEGNPEYNPIYGSETLRLTLTDLSAAQKEPVILRDDFQVYFVCIKTEDARYMAGPFSTRFMDRAERHRFYHFYGVDKKWEKGLHYYTLMEILQITCMITNLLTGQEYTDEQLISANYHSAPSAEDEKQEQICFDIQSDDEDIYRHTYLEEREIIDAVKDGDAQRAVRLSKEMDPNIGRLGKKELDHWKNLSLVSITLCARAAIEGGVMPAIAYRLSGFYINKCTSCSDVTHILIFRNHAVAELADRVKEQKSKRHTPSYTERCKDYVYRNYRQKIYLDDIADTLGLNSSYLSRLFKKETGTSLQDFINDVRVERAANLLIYSEESLPAIAQYVNFPTQSYFGKIFKQKMQMTPRQYRELHKPTEFYDNPEK